MPYVVVLQAFHNQKETDLHTQLSTMDLSILSQNHVSITTLDEKYLPTAIVLPFEGDSRQSKLIHRQVELSADTYQCLWYQIIKKKISNQSRALSIIGFEGAERIASYAESLTLDNIDQNEAVAAKDYFSYYHEGLNRRSDDPINVTRRINLLTYRRFAAD